MFFIVIESKKICKAISWFIPVEAITLYPFIICVNRDNKIMLNHESIHLKQQQELLIIPFFIVYVFHWMVNLIKYNGNTEKAYLKILFEEEAYANENNFKYLKTRLIWSCFRKKV